MMKNSSFLIRRPSCLRQRLLSCYIEHLTFHIMDQRIMVQGGRAKSRCFPQLLHTIDTKKRCVAGPSGEPQCVHLLMQAQYQDPLQVELVLPPFHIQCKKKLCLGFSSSVFWSFCCRLLVHSYAMARLASSQLTVHKEFSANVAVTPFLQMIHTVLGRV